MIHALVEPESQADPKFQTPLAYTRMTAKAVHEQLKANAVGKNQHVPAERTVRKAKPQKKFPKPMPSSTICDRSTPKLQRTRKRSESRWTQRPR